MQNRIPPSSNPPEATLPELDKYREVLRRLHTQALFIPRQLMTREDWDRAISVDYLRMRGAFREATPDLAAVLQHRCVTIVGEPGLGKTVLAQASVLAFLEQGCVPFFLRLAEFNGDLQEMLRHAGPVPEFFLKPSGTDGFNRAFVFDGLDEIRDELRAPFLAQLSELIARDPGGKFVLTCRQAVYQQLRREVPPAFEEFFPLGFDGDDVLEYARRRGLANPVAFGDELERLDLWLEASVPFVLTTLIGVYTAQQRLEPTRSENLAFVVDDLLSKRGRIGVLRLRKALQWLGLAMELYSRNELTEGEATRLLSDQMRITAAEAKEMLEELGSSVLIRTPTGVRFQMRSFGEYFAARQLEMAPLPQILGYAQFKGTLVLNPTWQNTISYLIELDPRVRGYFVVRHPDWVLTSSASAFSAGQKQEVVGRTVSELRSGGRYLLEDTPVNHHRLARLLSPADIPLLQGDLNATLPAARANALVLLGHLKDLSCIPLAVDLALDRSVAPGLRRAAFAALALTRSDEPIPRLLTAYDETDPLGDTCLDTAGALMSPATLAQVLPALLRTQTILSAAIARVGEMRNRAMLVAVLDYYLGNPDAACNRRVTGYTQPLWKSLRAHHDGEILGKVGHLLAVWEQHQSWDIDRDILNAVIEAVREPGGRGCIARTALQDLLDDHVSTRVMGRVIGRLCDVGTAQWLMEQNPGPEFVLPVASAADDEVRQIFLPLIAPAIAQQEENQRDWAREDEERRLREEEARQESSRRILTETDELKVLQSFAVLGRSKWPELPLERRTWLEDVVSRWLRDADALRCVNWTSPLHVTMPGTLHVLTQLAAHYGLRLSSDRLMIHALLAVDANTIAEYHRKQCLSNDAIMEFERLLADPELAIGASSHFISFAQQAALQSASIYDSLRRISLAPAQSEMNRSWAARSLGESSCPDDILIAIRRDATEPGVVEVVLDALTRRQHLPTIFERLGRLLEKDDILRSAERPFPATTEVNWIGSIKTPKAWGLLSTLRKRLLELALPTLCSLVEGTLATIDKKALIALLHEQLPGTPEPWREYLQHRAAEYERELQFERALATTFDEVLMRLSANSIAFRAKVLCEGPSDAPVYRALLSEGILRTVVVQPVNGWKNVLSRHFDIGPFLDGFQCVTLVLDGDRGRNWSSPDHPLNNEAEKLVAKLAQAGVQVHVLERYGIENYFSLEALAAVLGRDLGTTFPLNPYRPVAEQIDGYDKRLNDEVARRMKKENFVGTDLARIIEGLAKRIAEMS
jgi:hypothetical protein